jgi:para-aminobenzoate synthetase component 1
MDSDGPVIQELDPPPDAEAAFLAFSRLPHCLFLDSALRHPRLGRFSFLAADPFETIEVAADRGDALGRLGERLAKLTGRTVLDLPPFQGGAAGLFSYDLNRSLERLPAPRFDEFGVPALAVGLYDVVLAFDHQADRAWLISQGLPELEPAARRQRAEQRLAQFRVWLAEGRDAPASRPHEGGRIDNSSCAPVRSEDLAPQYPVSGVSGLTSTFSADGYRQAVRRVVDYIYAGDAFQVNLAQRLLYPAATDSVSLYQRLRQRNPATFAGYFDLGAFQVVSASPERFVQVRGRHVETRPIKGTRRRTFSPESDLFAGDELLSSEKDRAENVMIVDLLRNDLSRVCEPDSVRVTQLCQLEVYQYVQHLVSAVCGRLADGRTVLDLLRAAFPGGSITGAPKVRAMEIITELESVARGPYCGCLGYLGFDGALDLSILIRTITAGRGWWQLPVGGGVVAQSKPQAEYEETWHKAMGLIKALR